MSPTVTSVEQIDLDLSIAFVALGVARAAFLRCPSGENELAVARAGETVDQLLDARLAVRP